MGVEREYFIIYGIKSDYHAFGIYAEDEHPSYVVKTEEDLNKLRKSDYNAFIDPKMICISDEMGGKYSVFGICVDASGQDRWGDERDINTSFSRMDIDYLDMTFQKECVNQKIDLSEFRDAIGLHIIRHYT